MGIGHGIISLFARHRVAANLLMALMLLSGIWSLMRLNTQFFPDVQVNYIDVYVEWTGASAEDVERSITTPIEQEVRNISNIKKMTSVSKTGSSNIRLRFKQRANMSQALEQVRQKVSQVKNLPPDSEEPLIEEKEFYEPIAKVIISGPDNLQELRPLVHKMERDLLDRGIAKITVTGLPEQEIAIQIPTARLAELNTSLDQIALRIAARSQDVPAGVLGRGEVVRQLRGLQQQRDIQGFEQLPLMTDERGRILRVGDIAVIEKRSQDREVKVFYQDKPALELTLLRTKDSSVLHSAEILQQWLKEVKPTLGPNVSVKIYDESWRYVKQRINLLLKNGAGGLILILIILFLLLNHRVAFWVAAGIPISFFAALAALYLFGGSINMVSLFAFIMTLGIIVDDTIVVGEEALTQYQQGRSALESVEVAAHTMAAPIFASSLTTVSAFFPLMLVSGVIGMMLFSIPLIVICVIFASLLECFLVLPGHLHRSFTKEKNNKKHKVRERIDTAFMKFKDNQFRKIVTWAVEKRWLTLSLALSITIITAAIVFSGRVNFTFFPSPDASMIHVNAEFTASTPPKVVHDFLKQVEQALYQTNTEFKEKNKQSTLLNAVLFQNQTNEAKKSGENFGSLTVELTQPDDRTITNKQFIQAWRQKIILPPGIKSFSIAKPSAGPPGEDIDIQLSVQDLNVLKQASLALQQTLSTYTGVSDVKDDLPFGQEQLIYDLNSQGKALGLTMSDVGRQLRAAFNGQLVQIFHEPNDEIEVRVMLPDNERDSLATLEQLPIITSSDESIPLGSVVNLKVRQGIDVLPHTNTVLTAHVVAKVNNKVTNSNKVISSLKEKVIPQLIKDYGVKVSFEGRAAEQRETLDDMIYGVILALVLIYIILAWVFSSYGWPILVMLAIPLGLVGAVIGHMIMNLDMTILSLFGFFGLSGIVINDSIILLCRYRALRELNMSTHDAIIEAACQRLRPVLLTSLTTIAGLTPLLFETSIQAQFLIPMAASITFGLAFATILILLVIPAMLSVYEKYAHHG